MKLEIKEINIFNYKKYYFTSKLYVNEIENA